MSNLGYEERKRIVGAWLVQFLKRYEVPASFDKLRAQDEMVFMVEDINSEIPSGLSESSVNTLLERVAQYTRKNTASRTWPTIKTFIKGVHDSAERVRLADVDPELARPVDFEADLINAGRIKRGEPVSEWYVFGSGANYLIEKGLVSKRDLDKYRKPNIDVSHNGVQ